MKKVYFPETGKTQWQVESWFQKTIYVIGWISLIYLGTAFSLGLIVGILSVIV